ncbi:hypothetical protein J6590_044033 [Homalodisca vitripennis]|nr:hypothetical protein J6590_044033 [Homalodisca vitripennis]
MVRSESEIKSTSHSIRRMGRCTRSARHSCIAQNGFIAFGLRNRKPRLENRYNYF